MPRNKRKNRDRRTGGNDRQAPGDTSYNSDSTRNNNNNNNGGNDSNNSNNENNRASGGDKRSGGEKPSSSPAHRRQHSPQPSSSVRRSPSPSPSTSTVNPPQQQHHSSRERRERSHSRERSSPHDRRDEHRHHPHSNDEKDGDEDHHHRHEHRATTDRERPISSSDHPRGDSKPRDEGGPSRPSASNLPGKMTAMSIDAPKEGGAPPPPVHKIRTATRPGYGTVGRPVTLRANFFPLRMPPNLIVTQYAVSISLRRHPDYLDPAKRKKRRERSDESDREKVWIDVSAIEPIFYNRNVFKAFYEKYSQNLGSRLAYDGRSIAYGPGRIRNEYLDEEFSFSVNREGLLAQEGQGENRVEEVRVTISFAKELKMSDILRSRRATVDSVEYLAALDNVLAHSPMARYVQVGRSFYSPNDARPLGRDGSAVSAWRGFYQSARLSQLGVLVNLDESFTTFWNGGGESLMSLVWKVNGNRDFTGEYSQVRALTSALKLLKVRATHNGITYKVHGFAAQGSDQLSFEDGNGRRVSITEYFHEKYGIRLRYGHVPCVKTHPKRDTFLPMEMLTVVQNQRMMGLLSPDQTATMVRCASTKPMDKQRAARETMQNLKHSSDPLCRDFGINVDANLVSVNARILPTPVLRYQQNRTASVQSGSWRAGGKFLSAAILNTWAVIVESNSVPQPAFLNFMKELRASAGRGGLEMREPTTYTAGRNRISEELARVAHDFRDQRKWVNKMPLQMVLIVKDREETASYNAIKRAGDLQYGVVTQVVLAKNLRKQRGLNMYCDNVMLKINSKLGGQNFSVAQYAGQGGVPDVPFLKVPHMVLGADVTHPMAGANSPSVAALVGSRDKEGIQYSASIRTQKGRQEVIEDLGEMFHEVYANWLNNFGNRYQVQAIVMFRDGVSEGQFEEVMMKEVEALRRACKQAGRGCHPKITYIIVTKRHHARFFPPRECSDRSGNVLPGTVVDRDVTSNEFYDFYLNSHAGIQGTNKPSKYTVLIDENNIPPDALQGFVYRLAHGFVRCNRAVSMVNSAYYAHLLAFRGRAYLGEDGSDAMSMGSGSTEVPPTPQINANLKRRLYFV